MDVVKRNVEALRRVDLDPQRAPARARASRIKLPLTLAIIDGQSLSASASRSTSCRSPRSSSRSAPWRSAVTRVLDHGETVTVRGHVLPVIRLHELFGVAPRTTDLTEALVVIVEHEARLAALMVDELLGQQQVVIKSLERNFRKVDGRRGRHDPGRRPRRADPRRARARDPRPARGGPGGGAAP